MTPDTKQIYTHNAHFLLTHWAAWARSHRLISRPTHVLARLIRQRLDEDYTVGFAGESQDFTPELEAVDKAVAKLRDEDIRLRRVVMRYYMRGQGHIEIAKDMRLSVAAVRRLHARALELTHDHARVIYQRLTH